MLATTTMRLRSALALATVLFGTPALAQITYDGQITEPDWYLLDTDDGGPGNGFGDFNTLNAIYADIADDGSSVSLAMAGLVDRNASAGNRNYLVVLLDTRAGGYSTGNFGRASGPGGGRGVSNLNSGVSFDDGFFADYALQITCGVSDCFFDLYTLSGTAGSGGGPNTFLGTEADPDLGSFLDFGDSNTRTRGYEVRLTASGDGIGTDIQLDRPSIQAFAFIINADTGFLSNQFLSPADPGAGNYENGPVDFNAAAPDPVVYAEQTFVDFGNREYRGQGYRSLAAPARGLTVQWLADQDVVAYNGTPNGGPPRFVLDDYDPEAGDAAAPFVAASAFSDPLAPGNGFFWYLSDGRRGSQPLPWTFEGGGPMATGMQTQTHNLNDDGFYFVGNPFVTGLDVANVASPNGTIAEAAYVYNPESGSYETFSRLLGDVLAPMQGAFFEITENEGETSITWEIPQSARDLGGTFVPSSEPVILVEKARLVLERQTEDGWGRADALTLATGEQMDTGKPRLAPDGSPLATRLTAEGDTRGGLGQIGIPARGLRALLALDAQPGDYRFVLQGALQGQTVRLMDTETGETTALGTAPYGFTATGDLAGRFTLVVAPEGETAPEASGVGAVYPNPAVGVARVLVDLPSRQMVRVDVLDLLGRVVATAFEGEVQTEALALDTRALPSGAYLVRISGETVQQVRRLTVTR